VRSAARLLDDELTNDAPIGFDGGRRAQSSALWPEPCAEVVKSGVTWARVAAALMEVETAHAVLRVRRAVLALVTRGRLVLGD
jgi:hypothetical protein